ncbi:MAG: MFS transporter [Gammaproteobacteria bacterium]|nr:MFS transporter [Gammaproteobacteria bacterium]
MSFLSSTIKKYFKHYQGLSKEAWEAILLTFLESLAGGLTFVLSVYFVSALHFSVHMAGYLIASFSVGTTLGGLITGRLSDHMSPRYITVVSIFIHAVAYGFLVYLHNFTALIINLFVMGVCSYGVITSNRIWLMKLCGADSALRLKTVNICYAVQNLASGISSIFLGFFTMRTLPILFQCSTAILFFTGILLLFRPKHLPVSIQQHFHAAAQKPSTHSSANLKIFLFVLACLCVAGFYISQMATTYNVFVEYCFPQMGLLAIGILSVVNTFAIVFFQAPLVAGIKDVNKLLIIGVGLTFMGCSYIVLNYSFELFSVAIISMSIYSAGEMLFFAVAQLLCYENAPEKRRGQAIGIYQAVYSMSRVVGPVIGGFMYQYGSPAMLWYFCALIGLLCLAFCIYYREFARVPLPEIL